MRRFASSLPQGSLFAFLFTAGFGLSAEAAGPSAGDDGRVLRREVAVSAQQTLRLEVAYGELTIEPGDGDVVTVEFKAHCRRDGDRCRRRLEKLDIRTTSRPQEVEVRIEGLPRLQGFDLESKVVVRVPAAHGPLSVHMGAGEVRITGLGHDLNVELGAGDIEIRMPEDAVRSVELQAGVGDTRLRRTRGSVETARAHLIGASVSWDEGRGDAHVEAQVGAGDVNLVLD